MKKERLILQLGTLALALVVGAVCLLAAGQIKDQRFDDALAVKSVEFDKHWNKFLLEQLGCPLDKPLEAGLCNRSRGFIDYHEWTEARHRAKELFQLEDKK